MMTMHKKSRPGFWLWLPVLLILMLVFSCVGKKDKDTVPEAIKVAEKKQGPGDVWIEPEEMTVTAGESFSNEIHMNSGTQRIAAYGIFVVYDSKILSIEKDIGNNGATEGPAGFVQAVNPNEKDRIIISGFDTSSKGGPGEDLHMVNVHWKALKAGTSNLYTQIKNLVTDDAVYSTVGNPTGFASKVIVE